MRCSALLLVLSLVSPAVVTAVCELVCLQAHHHSTGEALAAQCHGRDASSAPVVTLSAADWALCHDGTPVPSAVVKASPQFVPMPALVISPRPSEFREPATSWFRSRPGFGPPGVLLITTQLRI
jgi:hypothetical protein